MRKPYWVLLSLLPVTGCASAEQQDISQGGISVSRPDIEHHLLKKNSNYLLTGKLILPADMNKSQALTVVLEVSNPQSYSVPLLFSSGKSGDLFIYNKHGKKIWNWSEQMMFTQVIREVTLAPGKPFNVSFTVPANVIAGLWGGDYTFQATFAAKSAETDKKLLGKVSKEVSLKD